MRKYLSRFVGFALLSAAAVSFAFGQAPNSSRQLFIATGDGSGGVVKFLAEPLIYYRSYVAAPNIIKVIPRPDGQKIYVVSGSPARTLVVVNNDFVNELASFDLGTATGAWMTPDGGRLLVLAGKLRFFDTSTDKEVTPAQLNLGSPTDVAISKSGRRAYVLSAPTKSLLTVDLNTLTLVGGALQFSEQPTGVSVGPNDLVYVSAPNVVYEIDGAAMKILRDIATNGQPGKLSFAASGKRGYALNAITSSGTPLLVFNLETRAQIGASWTTSSSTFKEVIVAGDDRVYAVSNENGTVYSIPPDGGLATPALFGQNSPFQNVQGIIVTDELPRARNMYLVRPDEIVRVDLNADSVVDRFNYSGAPLAFGSHFVNPSTGQPVSVLAYNDQQNVAPGDNSLPLLVRVLASNGQPLRNVNVMFSTSASGAVIENSNVTTNAEGYAGTVVKAPSTPGAFAVNASVGGKLSASFTITVTQNPGSGGGGPAPNAPAVYSGNGQVLRISTEAPFPLVVIVKNAAGQPAVGVPVSWSITSGTVRPLTSITTVTNAQGLAELRLLGSTYIAPGSPFETSQITASTSSGTANFYVTTLADPPGGFPAGFDARLVRPTGAPPVINAQVGQQLSGAIEVVVTTTLLGQVPIPNVGIEIENLQDPAVGPAARCTNAPVTNSQGIATCNLQLYGKPGEGLIRVNIGGQSVLGPIRLNLAPGQSAQIVPQQGNNASRNPGEEIKLVAQIRDAAGNPLPNATATWEVIPSNAGTLSNTTSQSDTAGNVSTVVKIGVFSGPFKVRVRSGTAEFEFSLAANVQLNGFTKIPGSEPQTAIVDTDFSKPVGVQVTDANGAPVANAEVTFTVTTGVAFLSATSARTNQEGIAAVTVKAGTVPGPVVVRATLGNLTADFSLTVTPPGPVFTALSFYNAAGFQQGLAPGALARVLVSNIAPGLNGSIVAPSALGPWPLELNGVTLQIGGIFAPIYAISNIDGQESITFQVPFEVAPGQTSVTIRAGEASTTVDDVTVSGYSPGVFQTAGPDNRIYAVLTKADGSYVTPENPAERGEILKAYVTGLGATAPAAGTNHAGTGGQNVLANIVVGVNHAGTRVISAEYAENMIGVYVVTFEVPSDTPAGSDVPFVVAIREDQNPDLLFSNPSAIAAIR